MIGEAAIRTLVPIARAREDRKAPKVLASTLWERTGLVLPVPRLIAAAAVVACAALASAGPASAASWSRFCVLRRDQVTALIGRIVVQEGNAAEHDCSYVGDPYGLNMVQHPAGSVRQVRHAPQGTKVTALHGIGRDATLTTRPLTRIPGVGAEVAFTVRAVRYEISVTVTRTSLSSRQLKLLVADSRALAKRLR